MPPKFKKGIRAVPEGEEDEALVNVRRFAEISRRAEIDAQMGFSSFSGGIRIGWMLNMQSVALIILILTNVDLYYGQ
jgi:hypothetical protein